jgi:hypothetical protein
LLVGLEWDNLGLQFEQGCCRVIVYITRAGYIKRKIIRNTNIGTEDGKKAQSSAFKNKHN